MIIEKVLNNNVVVVIDEGIEKVVMGRGIAFKKSTGDSFDESEIDKIFTLDHETNGMFQELIVNVPLVHIELVDEFILYAKMHIAKQMNDLIYISLIDHISTAIKRFEDGVSVQNSLLWDVKRFYKDEFELGLFALELIHTKTGNELPVDEAVFIALHLVNSQLKGSHRNRDMMVQITQIIQEISSIVKYTFNIDFDEDSVYFYRFITHLKFFGERIIKNDLHRNEGADELLDMIKLKYVDAYQCVLKVVDFIATEYNYMISPEEILYLTIHTERIISVSKKAGEKE